MNDVVIAGSLSTKILTISKGALFHPDVIA